MGMLINLMLLSLQLCYSSIPPIQQKLGTGVFAACEHVRDTFFIMTCLTKYLLCLSFLCHPHSAAVTVLLLSLLRCKGEVHI